MTRQWLCRGIAATITLVLSLGILSCRHTVDTESVTFTLWRTSMGIRLNVVFKKEDDKTFQYRVQVNGSAYGRGKLEGTSVEGLVTSLLALPGDSVRAQPDPNREIVQLEVTHREGDLLTRQWAARSTGGLEAMRLVRGLKPLDEALSEALFRMPLPPNTATAWPGKLPTGSLWEKTQNDLKRDLQTAQHSSLLYEHPELMSWTDENGQQPIHLAVQNGNVHVLNQLLEAGAKVEVRDSHGYSPFLLACQESRSDARVLPQLAKAGANVHGTLPDGKGGLHLAVAASLEPKEQSRRIRTLIRLGLSPHVVDKQGKSPLDLSHEFKRPDLASLMESFTALQPCKERLAVGKFELRIEEHLLNQNFSELERIAAQLLEQRLYFSHGEPQLEIFYRVASGLTGADHTQAQSRLNAWVAAFPRSAPARIARARFWVSYAWAARGSGFADTVEPESWKLFYERLHEAEKDLLQARVFQPHEPYIYADSIKLAMALGWDRKRMESLLNQALAELPGCPTALRNAAMYLLPRWHGQDGELKIFAQKYLTRDPASYSVLWEGVSSHDGIVEEGHFPWDQLQTSYRARLKIWPSEIVKHRFACSAAIFRKDGLARQLVQQLGDTWDPESWDHDADFYIQFRQ